MAIEITVPRLGWTMEEGTFVGWLKQAGERVKEGEPLFIIEGDKATEEVAATDSGVLHIPPGSPATGSDVRVGALLGYLLAEGETFSAKAVETQQKERARPEPVAAPTKAAPNT